MDQLVDRLERACGYDQQIRFNKLSGSVVTTFFTTVITPLHS